MKLSDLLTSIQPTQVLGATDVEIESLCYDSRRAAPGALFFALKGEKVDGAQFVPRALERGAVAVVSESALDLASGTNVVVGDARAAMADLAAHFFGNPSHGMKVAGVTGTNGKTTTTFLLKHLCDQTFWRCGLIGTVRYDLGGRTISASRTTPESLDVHEMLSEMRDAGSKSAVMEVSSHALVQSRVRAVEFDTAIFTTLTQDHLDYHKTMEAYFEAKTRLFIGLSTQQKKRSAKAVINLDDRYGARLVSQLDGKTPVVTYGMGARADFRASNVRMDFGGASYQLDARSRSYLVRLPLIGNFNVYNSLAAIAAAHAMGIDVRASVLAMANAPSVPGRLQAVPGQRSFKIFVDYAHTDDALINVLRTLRELGPARIVTVFGCGGNRDRGKRPRMGKAVDELSDFAIVTSDNPRKEDPLAIIEDIKPGMQRGAYEVVPDRRAAIFRAVELARPRDIILIAGKGHEAYQEFADQTMPFDDVDVARAALDAKPIELES
jgi:UDP-N-acetylmuramoyl-L-alanyl-D-glutamate--2,6-diaminopimelate ligase